MFTPVTDPAPYVPRPGTPTAIIVDVDGTVALKGDRSPYDESKVHLDKPNHDVIRAVREAHQAGHQVIFCSGRTEDCRYATEDWLDQHVGTFWTALYMRPAPSDGTKDAHVKAGIFDAEIRDKFHIVRVYDDRDQVVRMWRSIGLTVMQVAYSPD